MTPLAFSNEELQRYTLRIKAICEPNRLLLLEQIIEGVQCNCELGGCLHLAPNLISHHLSVLREAGLVEVERDPNDARWAYYTVNTDALKELQQLFCAFFDPDRIQPRRVSCGPQTADHPRRAPGRLQGEISG